MILSGRKNKAVFFDRDGTLIKTFTNKRNKPIAIKTLNDFKLLNNVKQIVNKLSKKYLIIVLTNQPDVARGKNSKKNVKNINTKLQEKLIINKVYTSYSDNDKNFMRKPNPGMIYRAKKDFDINLIKSYVIGDREKDVIAGKKARCKTILLKKKYNDCRTTVSDHCVKNFKKILDIIKV